MDNVDLRVNGSDVKTTHKICTVVFKGVAKFWQSFGKMSRAI